jgi:uncharacterized membrane protein YqaE (UPF0057 family)
MSKYFDFWESDNWDFQTNKKGDGAMGCGRVLLCILLPPLAVLDKGCGTVLLVALLTLFGWVPGAIAALVVCSKDKK